MRRLCLDSGAYDLTDFSFTSGDNRVQFIAKDRTRRRELAQFDVFLGHHLLAPGFSEWAFLADEISYRISEDLVFGEGDPAASGSYRRGLTKDAIWASKSAISIPIDQVVAAGSRAVAFASPIINPGRQVSQRNDGFRKLDLDWGKPSYHAL